MAINRISGNILQDDLQRGANLSIQGNLIYFDVTNDRVGIRTSSPADDFEVAGIFRTGNVTIDSTGNINAGNVYINNLSDPTGNQDAATKYYVDVNSGSAALDNLVVSNTTISTSLVTGNITFAPTGNSLVEIAATSGLLLPTGNTAQRPSPAQQGTLRYNTDLDRAEIYDGASWEDLVANVTNQTLAGDSSTLVFTLDRASTTAATLIIINGTVQLPAVAYSISGNVLTFTQAPSTSDIIDIRFL